VTITMSIQIRGELIDVLSLAGICFERWGAPAAKRTADGAMWALYRLNVRNVWGVA
jgi:hypothetical protein